MCLVWQNMCFAYELGYSQQAFTGLLDIAQTLSTQCVAKLMQQWLVRLQSSACGVQPGMHLSLAYQAYALYA